MLFPRGTKTPAREENYVDEVHAGAILATVYALQARWYEMKKEVAELNWHRATRRKQFKEARTATTVQEDHAMATEEDLQKARDALHQAQEERDEARAVYQTHCLSLPRSWQIRACSSFVKSWTMPNGSWNTFVHREVSQLLRQMSPTCKLNYRSRMLH